jgi:hypothetical protein
MAVGKPFGLGGTATMPSSRRPPAPIIFPHDGGAETYGYEVRTPSKKKRQTIVLKQAAPFGEPAAKRPTLAHGGMSQKCHEETFACGDNWFDTSLARRPSNSGSSSWRP